MPAMIDYKEALANIARAIVDEPDKVCVTEKESASANTISLELSVAPDDMGKVIGKHGKIAQAIRQIKSSAPGGKKIVVDIR